MTSSWLAFLFAIGIAQGLFLSLVLLTSSAPNRLTSRSLGLLVLVFTASIAEELIDILDLYPVLPHSMRAAIWLEFAIGPLILAFVYGLSHRKLPSNWWLHFIPLLVCIALWSPFYFSPADYKLEQLGQPISRTMAGFVLIKALYLFAYLMASLRLVPKESNGRRARALRWIRPWLMTVLLMTALLYGNFVLNFFRLAGIPDSDHVGSLVLAAIIFVLAFAVIRRPELLAAPSAASFLTPQRRQAFADRLERHLQREKPYLDPELTVVGLAQQLDMSETQLSEVLNEHLGQNFYAFVSDHRLDDVVQRLADPDNDDMKVLDIALDAGFNSKASFYRVFRERFHMTPNQYRARLRQQKAQKQTSH